MHVCANEEEAKKALERFSLEYEVEMDIIEGIFFNSALEELSDNKAKRFRVYQALARELGCVSLYAIA